MSMVINAVAAILCLNILNASVIALLLDFNAISKERCQDCFFIYEHNILK